MSTDLTFCIYISTSLVFLEAEKQAAAFFLCSPTHHWRISYIHLQRGFHSSKVRYKWTKSEAYSYSKHRSSLNNHGLYMGILKFSTSAPEGTPKLSIGPILEVL
jgi:hypothetical protein